MMHRRESSRSAWWLDTFFRITLFIKGLDGIVEVIGGSLLLLVGSARLNNGLMVLTQPELASDPADVVVHWLLFIGHYLLVDAKVFAIIYLLTHGLIKIVLVVSLLREKLAMYPWAMGILSGLMVYQLYRYVHTHAVGLLIVTLFDALVVWLVWREYGHLKTRLALQDNAPYAVSE